MQHFSSRTQKIGLLGEKIAQMFLVKHGFTIVETNFTKKAGEIDIIASKNGTLHFIEVKSVSGEKSSVSGSHETSKTPKIRPEEMFHVKKQRRFTKTIQLYCAERRVSYETEWCIDLLTVYLNHAKRQGTVIPFWNIVF